jgi:hypothetical protein
MLSPDQILATIYAVPISFVVLRSMLGFTPPEWAYVTTQKTDVAVDQGAIRALDRRIRMGPLSPIRARGGLTDQRIRARADAWP